MNVRLAPLEWSRLDEPGRRTALRRSAATETRELRSRVEELVQDVRLRGDDALREYTLRYDGAELAELEVSDAEFAAAGAAIEPHQAEAIARAIDTVTRFHAAQTGAAISVETAPGVVCERIEVPIQSRRPVRAGRHRAAALHRDDARRPGAARRLPRRDPLHAAAQRRDRRSGRAVRGARLRRHRVYKVGGAQAIAAMAYRHRSPCRACDKMFGPGNA